MHESALELVTVKLAFYMQVSIGQNLNYTSSLVATVGSLKQYLLSNNSTAILSLLLKSKQLQICNLCQFRPTNNLTPGPVLLLIYIIATTQYNNSILPLLYYDTETLLSHYCMLTCYCT